MLKSTISFIILAQFLNLTALSQNTYQGKIVYHEVIVEDDTIDISDEKIQIISGQKTRILLTIREETKYSLIYKIKETKKNMLVKTRMEKLEGMKWKKIKSNRGKDGGFFIPSKWGSKSKSSLDLIKAEAISISNNFDSEEELNKLQFSGVVVIQYN